MNEFQNLIVAILDIQIAQWDQRKMLVLQSNGIEMNQKVWLF